MNRLLLNTAKRFTNKIPIGYAPIRLNTRFNSTNNQVDSAIQHGVKTMGVVGAGQMGTGIAIVGSMVGNIRVLLMDVSEDTLDNSRKMINKIVSRGVEKGKLTDDQAQSTLDRISTVTTLDGFADTQFVVEAVNENFDLKEKILRQLDSIVPPDGILATNTSSISITKLGAATSRPSKVIGMHWMNPVPVMKLVEVIPSLATSPETLTKTLALAEALGKTTALASDVPGFLANRVLMPYINEAIQALYEKVATKEDIDTIMKLGTGVPMGPLTLADFIGLDTCLSIMQVLHREFGDSKYRPSPLLVKHVEANWLGRKSGRGFFKYD